MVPALALALFLAISLNVYCLSAIWKEHLQVDQAFRDTDCEFSSIFQNVLDGVLIVDNSGNCLDANPASAEILRCPLDEVISANIRRFFPDPLAFAEGWNSFLRVEKRRGRVHLLAGDGARLVVDFTSASNYLPDRSILIICDVTERTTAEKLLKNSEERFQHMANNIQEIFWMMDARTHELAYVNRAYATITGHSIESLRTNPSSYRELIHPEDRVGVVARLNERINTGGLDEEFRFTKADGTVRWIWAKGFPVPSEGETRWLVGTAQDITARKEAEMKITDQLNMVEAARAEAEALRRATLTLAQNLAMDAVLDTLLECIHELVPFDKGVVLFVEDGAELLVARELPRSIPTETGAVFPASAFHHLEQIVFGRNCFLLEDLSSDEDLRKEKPLWQLRSWLGVPLVAGGRVLGVLSLGNNLPGAYTPEHLRLAQSLAVPAAVAIQNARIHERAEIYATELELRLKQLHETQVALNRTRQSPTADVN